MPLKTATVDNLLRAKFVAFLKDEAILNVPVLERFVHNSGLAWIGLWCLTPLSAIVQLYRWSQFY